MVLDGLCSNWGKKDDDSVEEVTDDDAVGLTHVGTAAYDVLRKKHGWYHNSLWNVTSGTVVGEVHQTPLDGWSKTEDPEDGHDDWFPEKMAEILARTKVWCDLMSLGPPDGMFMDKFKEALGTVAENAAGREKPATVRMMFGNIVGMPVNCDAVIKKLTEDLPTDANIRLWVGAWRKGVSWNHAKIIAVDGRYLHTGGHNLWDAHYLKFNPVHDLSLEMEGKVANDGHLFANEQWNFIESSQSTMMGECINSMPDDMPMLTKTRVTVSEYPEGVASTFPPRYRRRLIPDNVARAAKPKNGKPVITMGRFGTLLWRDRPSDDAFIAMLDSAKTIIRMALQDLGPVCLPGTKVAVPGLTWPKAYLSALGRVMWQRGVDVEIALSNPGSIPAGLGATEACYGNGWTCVDVAAEVVKTILKQFPNAEDGDLRRVVTDNLRVCFIREGRRKFWSDGTSMGMHAKHFIIDDVSTYIGSQNLYVCDLAEWGVLLDDEETTKRIMAEYWNPMWESSFTGEDVDVQEVMDGLDIDRDGESAMFIDAATQMKIDEAAKRGSNCPTNREYFCEDEASNLPQL